MPTTEAAAAAVAEKQRWKRANGKRWIPLYNTVLSYKTNKVKVSWRQWFWWQVAINCGGIEQNLVFVCVCVCVRFTVSLEKFCCAFQSLVHFNSLVHFATFRYLWFSLCLIIRLQLGTIDLLLLLWFSGVCVHTISAESELPFVSVSFSVFQFSKPVINWKQEIGTFKFIVNCQSSSSEEGKRRMHF